MRTFIKILALFVSFGLTSCGSKKTQDPKPDAEIEKPVLRSPAANSVCVIGDDATQTTSAVSFDWDESRGAERYTITIKNLLSQEVLTKEANASALTAVLNRAMPYSWTVTARSAKTNNTAQSDTWKFYNSGVGQTNHAPFPAGVVFPETGTEIETASGKVTLKWAAADADGDLKSCQVYFSEDDQLKLVSTVNATASEYEVQVRPITTYRWKIISIDKRGNTSASSVFMFRVK